MKILVVSHGDIAKGFCDTAKKFFGASEIYNANVDLETGVKGLVEDVEKYLEDWKDEQVVICSDLKGGSANQTIANYISRPNTFVISGTNLSLILQLMLAQEVSTDSLHMMIEESKNDIVLVNDILANTSLDEDDE